MKENKKKITVRNIALMGMLIAIEIVLSRFLSIQAWNVKIGFAFIAPVCAAIIMGPVEAAIVGGVSDFLGTMMFPIGAYFPGFTLTACITGVVWGVCLNKKTSIPRILVAVGINQFVFSLFLNTYWISVLYGSPFIGLLPVRFAQSAVLFITQVVTITVLQEVLFKRVKRVVENPAMG